MNILYFIVLLSILLISIIQIHPCSADFVDSLPFIHTILSLEDIILMVNSILPTVLEIETNLSDLKKAGQAGRNVRSHQQLTFSIFRWELTSILLQT